MDTLDAASTAEARGAQRADMKRTGSGHMADRERVAMRTRLDHELWHGRDEHFVGRPCHACRSAMQKKVFCPGLGFRV